MSVVQNLENFGEHRHCSPRHLELLTCTLYTIDPFADEGDPLAGTADVGSQANHLHIRIQQRNGRKTLTTLQGLPKGRYNIHLFLPWLYIPFQNMIRKSY